MNKNCIVHEVLYFNFIGNHTKQLCVVNYHIFICRETVSLLVLLSDLKKNKHFIYML